MAHVTPCDCCGGFCGAVLSSACVAVDAKLAVFVDAVAVLELVEVPCDVDDVAARGATPAGAVAAAAVLSVSAPAVTRG